MLRRSPWWLLLALVWLSACGRAPAEGHGHGVLTVKVDLGPDATEIHEAHLWQQGHGPASRELDLPWIEGQFPLRPRFELRSATLDKQPIEAPLRRYDDWIDIDLPLGLDPDVRHRVDLEYALRGAWERQDEQTVVLGMQQVGPDSPVELRNVSLMVVAPVGASLGLWVADGYTEYERRGLQPRGDPSDGMQAWVAKLGPSKPHEPMFWRLGVTGWEPTPLAYGPTLVEQGGSVPWTLLVVVVVALGLRLQPADRVIAVTRVLHLGLLGVAAWEVVGLQLAYWWPEVMRREAAFGDALAEVALSMGLLALTGAFVWAQERGLRARKPEAYVLEASLPLALATALPMVSVRSAYLLLPLLGLPGLLAWFRRSVALAMGADLHRLVEAVQTRGHTTVAELSAELRLRPAAVRALLRRHGELSLVWEPDSGEVLSASAAALREDLRRCPSCGGTTRVVGQDRLACPFCEREYASARAVTPQAPVPLVLRAIVVVLRTLGQGLMAWATLLSVAFVTMSVFDEEDMSFVAAVIVAAILLTVAFGALGLLQRMGQDLLEGRGYGLLQGMLLCGLPLVVPAVVLWRVRSPRVRLHFGRYDLDALSAVLESKGQLLLGDFAQQLRTSWDEAFELAVHLCGSGALDAVFDRAGLRLVARASLRELAEAGTCRSCGGILGIVDGGVRCHHCGTEAEAA